MARPRIRNKVRNRGVVVRNKQNTLVSLFSYIQSDTDWKRWTSRAISWAKAEELEREGKALRVTRMYEGTVRTVGWRMQVPLRVERPSPTTLTMSTIKAVSGEYRGGDHGEKPTRGEFDHILKFRVWAIIGDQKAVAVRPRITDEERVIAESLMGQHGAIRQRECERLIA